jgi:hypothetical protein
MSDFSMPEVQVGDLVFWHDDHTGSGDPTMGWVIERPGRETISILVFTQSAGFVEKKSVRHRDDPFWRESEMASNWQRWGCFTEHPSTKLLKELKGLITKAKVEKARQSKEDAA